MTALVLMLALQIPPLCQDTTDEFRDQICDWIDAQERRREVALAVEATMARAHEEEERERELRRETEEAGQDLVHSLVTGGGSVGGVLGVLAVLNQLGVISIRKKAA